EEALAAAPAGAEVGLVRRLREPVGPGAATRPELGDPELGLRAEEEKERTGPVGVLARRGTLEAWIARAAERNLLHAEGRHHRPHLVHEHELLVALEPDVKIVDAGD